MIQDGLGTLSLTAAEKRRAADRRRWTGDRREAQNKIRKERMRELNTRQPWLYHLKRAKRRAREKGLEFALCEEWARQRWTGVCEVTGLPFKLDNGLRDSWVFSPSIDRVNQRGGYTPENCRFVLFGVNGLRANGSDDEMLVVAMAIVKRLNSNSLA
jgi:hypothetical protein